MELWKQQSGLVVLVEMPPAGRPETLLLSQTLSHLVWVVGSGQSKTRGLAESLQSFSHGRCPIIGAILNREPKLF